MSWQILIPYVSWLGNTGFAQWLGMSTLRIAGLLTIHLFGLTLLLGSIVVSSLQLLGIIRLTGVDVRRAVMRGATIGVVVMVTSGLLIFTGGAEAYYAGSWFRLKMCLLALALLFHFTIYRTVAAGGAAGFSPVTAKLTGLASLALWF